MKVTCLLRRISLALVLALSGAAGAAVSGSPSAAVDRLLLEQGAEDYGEGRYLRAASVFRQLLKEHPRSAHRKAAWILLARSCIRGGRVQRGEEHLRQFLREFPQESWKLPDDLKKHVVTENLAAAEREALAVRPVLTYRELVQEQPLVLPPAVKAPEKLSIPAAFGPRSTAKQLRVRLLDYRAPATAPPSAPAAPLPPSAEAAEPAAPAPPVAPAVVRASEVQAPVTQAPVTQAPVTQAAAAVVAASPQPLYLVTVGPPCVRKRADGIMMALRKKGLQPAMQLFAARAVVTRLVAGSYADRGSAEEALQGIRRVAAGAFITANRGRQCVVASSFVDPGNARREKGRLARRGISVLMEETDVPLESWQVVLGPYPSRGEAEAVLRRASSKGLSTAVVPAR